jgi:hypothetical protein
MADLASVLGSVRDRIARYRGQGIGEENTKTALIDPVLRALGWDLEDLDEVRHEYRRKAGDNPVDYALFLLRTPRLFVEAKALGENLSDHRWAGQFIGYAGVAGVEWVAVTDGNEWRIYNAHASVPIEEKLFRRVIIDTDEPNAVRTLSLLSKGQLQDNQIDALWKSDFVDRQVRDALVGLFTPEPDAAIVRLIRSRASSLSPSEVRASLGRLRATFDFPVVAPAAATPQPSREPKQGPSDPPRVDEPRTQEVGAGTPWRHVTLAELIGAGLVRLPLDIEHRYRGTRLVARIEAADRITFGGSTFESLSLAGGIARRSVVGAPPGRVYPQTNGWTFWEYGRAERTLGQLDELRRALYEGKVVSLTATRRAGA